MKHRNFALASMVAIPLILLLTTLLLARQFNEVQALTEQVRHSYDARFHLQKVLSLHQDLETGQRGYVLTGNPAFLEPYDAARRNIGSSLETLRLEIAGKSESAGYFDELTRLSTMKLDFANSTVRLQQEGRGSEAERMVATGRGQLIMDAIRYQIALIDGVERRHLVEALAGAEASRNETRLVTLSLQGLLLALLAAAAWVTYRARAARQRDLERLRDLSARQEAIFDAVRDAMITHDPQGYIESINPAAAQLYGYRPEDLIGRNVEVLAHETPGEETLEREFVRLANSGARVTQFEAKRRDGSTITVDASVSAVSLGDGLHYLAVMRDVTERRRVEQMKNEFVSTVSHELRTPLTSIAGSLGLLAGGVAGELPERASKLIRIAHSNSERLVRLINDILDIEKIESGKMSFDVKPVALRPLVEQAVQANSGFADGFGVRLEIAPGGEDAVVLADSDRLMQVVTNLLSNAAKFSPEGETVLVTLTSMGDMHRLTVVDRGPGISEAFRSRIFTKFAQADASDTRQKGGTGLGLSIVREIVNALGGTVSFETETGRGTAFHVDLPAPAATVEEPARPRILVCLERADGAEQIRRSLEKAGCDSDHAGSTDEVRALAARHQYSAVLLDLSLMGEESRALINALRADPRYASTPILVSSSEGADGEVSQALSVMDWLPKPASVDDFAAEARGAAARIPRAQPCILHVEDDPDVLRVVASAFEGKAELRSVADIETARKALRTRPFDLVILDLDLPGGSGIDLLPDMYDPDGTPIPVVIFSASESTPDTARRVEAALVKSRASLDDLVRTVERLIRSSPAHEKGRQK